jgi:uncharacterized protein YcfL
MKLNQTLTIILNLFLVAACSSADHEQNAPSAGQVLKSTYPIQKI